MAKRLGCFSLSIIGVIALAMYYVPSTSAQIYVYSNIDVLPGGSQVQATCATFPDPQSNISYVALTNFAFTADCSVSSSTLGTSTCPNETDPASPPQENMAASCTWNMAITPGDTYTLTAQHYVWFWSTVTDQNGNLRPASCTSWASGIFGNPGNPQDVNLPCGQPYNDLDWWTNNPPYGPDYNPRPGYKGMGSSLSNAVELSQPTNSGMPGNPTPKTQNFQVAKTTGEFVAMAVTLAPMQPGDPPPLSPPSTYLYQTQIKTFYSNLSSLQSQGHTKSDEVWWCDWNFLAGASGCPGFTYENKCPDSCGEGTLAGYGQGGGSAVYQAPQAVSGISGEGQAQDMLCATESLDPANYACVPVSLKELKLSIPQTDVTLGLRQTYSLTATVTGSSTSQPPAPVLPLTADHWSWTWNGNNVGTGKANTPTEDGSGNTLDTFQFIAGVVDASATLNVATTADLSGQGGASDYPLSGQVKITVSSNTKDQTITFPPVPSQNINLPFPLAAVSSSGLAVSYVSLTSSVCTVSGSVVSFSITGTCTVEAAQPGNSTYSAASPVMQSFAVNGINQTITFGPISAQPASTSLVITAAASSGLPVSFISLSPSICTVAGPVVSMLITGTCLIQASQPGNAVYAAAPVVTQSFTIAVGTTQFITFSPVASPQTATWTILLAATASSGLPVSFVSASSSVCVTVNASALLVGSGTCTIEAAQPGNSTYTAAVPVTQSFTVSPLTQSISFPAISSQIVSTTLSLAAVASSNLPVVYASATPGVCAVSGTLATMLTSGTCSITADQGGNAVYAAAPTSSQSFTVAQGTGTSSPGQNLGTVSLGSNSSLTVTFTSGSSATVGSVSVLTQGASGLDFTNAGGGTCAGGLTLVPAATCTVNVLFTPKASGTRYGAVVLTDASGNTLGTIYLQSTGVGPLLGIADYASKPIGSGLVTPRGIAVDAAGNVYIADSGSQQVYKESPVAGGGYAQSTIGSGFTSPAGVAVDGAGNVYVVDSGANQVYEETLSASGYSQNVVPTSTLAAPKSVAVDGSGNVYIADTGNARILKETLGGGLYSEGAIPTGGTSASPAVAVDGAGNVYTLDPANNLLFEASPSSTGYSSSEVPTSGLNNPTSLAVDGRGNIYIADTNNYRIVVESPTPTGYTQTLATGYEGLNLPAGVAVDGAGNVYASSTAGGTVIEDDFSDPAVLNAGTVSYATDSGAWGYAIYNFGTAPLSFSSVTYPADFPETAGIPADCASTTQLAQGGNCTLSISALPSQPLNGSSSLPLNENVTTVTNVSNPPGSQQILVNISGTEVSGSTSLAFAASANPALVGSNVTFTATVVTQATSNQPTGTVTYTAGSSTLGSAQVGVGGTAILSTTSLPIGTNTITASYSGDGNFSSATSNALSEIVTSGSAATAPGTTNLGSVNLGAAGAISTVTIAFSSTATLGAISVLTQGVSGLEFSNAGGGSCTVGNSYSANSTCTVVVAFTPQYAGTRFGAVVLADSSGNVLGTAYLEAAGVAPQISFPPGTKTTIASGFYWPVGVAVDGAGDVFVADGGQAAVFEESPSSGSYTQMRIPGTFSGPVGVSLDGAGNLYVADDGGSVYKEAMANGTYTQSQIGSGFRAPWGVAADGSGNVYVADVSGAVYKETPANGSYSQTQIGSGWHSPNSVAVDGAGNVYVADWGTYVNGTECGVLEKLALQADGSYVQSQIGGCFSDPYGVAVDGAGNVYVSNVSYASGELGSIYREALQGDGSYVQSIIATDPDGNPAKLVVDGNGNVYFADIGWDQVYKIDFADAPTLSFAQAVPNTISSDSPQILTVTNVGTAVLTFPVPSTGSNPTLSGSPFTLGNTANGCPIIALEASNAASLMPGQVCTFAINFTPTDATTYTGSLALTDNNLNASAPAYASQSITLSGTGIPAGTTSQTISFGPIPAETANTTLALSATASSGLPVVFATTTPGICTASGSMASLLASGSCIILANQPGDTTYAAASPVSQTFSVNPAPQSITFPTIATQVINTAVPVSLQASASSALPVTYTSTTPSVCSVSGSAANLLAAGTCSINADQPGNNVFAAAPTASQSFTVSGSPQSSVINFGNIAIGSSSAPAALTFTVSNADTLGTIAVLTDGIAGLDFANTGSGTCLAGTAYAAGGTCTVTVTFAPTRAGTRIGAATLIDSVGNVIATDYIEGTGTGPQVAFLPGTESVVPTSTLSYPGGVVVDGSGDLYLADTGNNRVLKETFSSGSWSESVVQTSALSYPSAVALDGAGNLYIADTGNNRVLEEIASGNTYAETTVPNSATFPEGIAVDASGNVYIADAGNNRILEETFSAGSWNETVIPTSTLATPAGLALDGSGSVYIADFGNNRVLKETPLNGSYTESIIPSSTLSFPNAVAVDGIGNVYIADSGHNRILEETQTTSGYSESVVSTSTLNYPAGVVIGGNGNVYVSDSGNNRLLAEDLADPPSLTFAATPAGSTSGDSPRTVTLENVGNAPLILPAPSAEANPGISANFTLNSSSNSACPVAMSGSGGTSLAANSGCTLSVSFTPGAGASGSVAGSVVLNDNALNAPSPTYVTQSINLSGSVSNP